MKLRDKFNKFKYSINNFIGALTIRKKTFLFFGFFTSCIIIILWLFQIVFLEDFYKFVKFQNIRMCSNQVYYAIKNNSLENFMNRFTDEDVSIYIYNEERMEIASYIGSDLNDKKAYSFTVSDFLDWYHKAEENGGTYTEHFSDYNDKMKAYQDQLIRYELKYPDGSQAIPQPHIMEGIVYTRIIYASSGEEYAIYIASMLSPVRSTIDTLRVQLIYIVIILSVLATILSIVISGQISKPIIKITKNAKLLPVGKYVPQPITKSYSEIDDLNSTLNKVSEELNKTEKLRQELLANISHDLRTPLTLITGYAEVMRDIPGESTPENIQIIIDEARRLELLVNDLLELSKLQSGTQKLNEEVFIITDAVLQAIERLRKFTEQNGYHIEFTYDKQIAVKADRLRMSQVMYNLIINALNYTGKDKLVVVTQTSDENNVTISVKDSGKGIPEEELKQIWNRYYRLGKNGKRTNIGTGLGLSIVSSIMDMHKGKYGVNSTVGKGSEFWISMPVCDMNLTGESNFDE